MTVFGIRRPGPPPPYPRRRPGPYPCFIFEIVSSGTPAKLFPQQIPRTRLHPLVEIHLLKMRVVPGQLYPGPTTPRSPHRAAACGAYSPAATSASFCPDASSAARTNPDATTSATNPRKNGSPASRSFGTAIA